MKNFACEFVSTCSQTSVSGAVEAVVRTSGMADVASLFGGGAADDTASLFGGAAPGYDPYGQPAAAAAPQGSPWTTGFTPEGFQYWFNESTGESSWYPPADMPPDTVGGAAQVPSAPDQSIYSSAPSDA